MKTNIGLPQLPVSGGKSALPVSLALLIPLAILAGMFFSNRLSHSPDRFPEFTAIIVPSTVQVEALDASLAAAGFLTVTKRNAFVSLSVFSGIEKVGVSALQDRLDSEDPRYDPYMRRVGEYFATEYRDSPSEIQYVKSAPSVTGLRRWLNRNGFREVIVDGYHRGTRMLSAGLFLLFVVAVSWYTRGHRVIVLILSLPWIGLIVGGWSRAYIPGAAFFMVSVQWVTVVVPHMRSLILYGTWQGSKKEIEQVVVATVLVIVGSVIAVFFPEYSARFAVGMLLSVVYSITCIVGVAFSLQIRLTRKQHRIFTPVGILQDVTSHLLQLSRKSRAGWRRSTDSVAEVVSRRALLYGGILLLVLPVVTGLIGTVNNTVIPTPVRVPGVTSYSWPDLERLAIANHVRELPDLADYVAHKAFQRGLVYGRPFEFPYPGESIYENTYSVTDGRIVAQRVPVLEYDHEWYESVLTMAATGDVSQLMVSPPKLSGIGWKPLLPNLISLPTILLSILLWMALAIPHMPGFGDLTAHVIYGTRSIISRRKRQAA